jgi:hypothetical protein
MIYRIYPIKDTFITNDYVAPNLTRLTGANLGFSEELDVFKRAGISGAIGSAGSSSLGRALLQFDLSKFAELTASGDIPTAGMTFRLRMNHKTRGCPEPESYSMTIRPVSSSWDEGDGMDVTEYTDDGYSNWEKRSSTDYWVTAGGDYLVSPTASAYFDDGTEDIDEDVTSIVSGWLSGTFPNYGVGVSITASLESDSVYTDYYRKKFYSRHSSYRDRRPYLEVRVDDFRGDDRTNMQWSRTGSLWLYNVIGGVFSSLAGEVVASIADASGVLLHVTASQVSTGIYSASFALPTGTYSGSLFYDRWRAGSVAQVTGTFTFSNPSPVNTLTQYPLTARIRNMQDEYLPEDVPVFEVFFRKRPHTLPVVQTASLGPIPYIVERAWYAIENDATRERVVPFGTGSQNHTRLSYGGSGNSFKFHMTNLHSGNVYRIVLLVDEQGRKQVIDPGFKFKVV